MSETQDQRVSKYLLLSPANVTHLTNFVSEQERAYITQQVANGNGEKVLPFELFGWLSATADTAYQWLYSPILNNVHVEKDGDFSQVSKIPHAGALLIGTLDRFTYGAPCGFLQNINDHLQSARENQLIFIEQTGHTYQQKEQEVADKICELIRNWGM